MNPYCKLPMLFTAALIGASGMPLAEDNTPMANNWLEQSVHLRQQVCDILTFPSEKVPLDAEVHRTLPCGAYDIECITFASEPGSRVTALLYLPAHRRRPVPGIVAGCGHGGSKSAFDYQYAGQLYAAMGFACLVPDTIGEEERHIDRGMGTRAHDLYQFKSREERRAFTRDKLRRMVLGKVIWDLERGVDYLQTRPEIDPNRIGVTGNSMGGATASCLAAIDSRIRAAVISGWSMTTQGVIEGKDCSRMPYEAFSQLMSFNEMTALLAPHAATLFINGDSDSIIDQAEGGKGVVRRIRACIAGAKQILADAGLEGIIEAEFVPGACHRPYMLTHTAVAWMQTHLMAPEDRRPLPEGTVRFGDWVEAHGQRIEKLYDTEARKRGTRCVDIGATLRSPAELACFPNQEHPKPEYTWQGWVEAMIAESKAADDPPARVFGLTRAVP